MDSGTHLDLRGAARKGFLKELIFGQVSKDHIVLGGGSGVDRFGLTEEGTGQGPQKERRGEQLYLENCKWLFMTEV